MRFERNGRVVRECVRLQDRRSANKSRGGTRSRILFLEPGPAVLPVKPPICGRLEVLTPGPALRNTAEEHNATRDSELLFNSVCQCSIVCMVIS